MEMIRACELALMVEANKEAKRIADLIAEQKRKEITFKYCEDVLVPLFMKEAEKALDNKISFSTSLMRPEINAKPNFDTDELVLYHGSIDNEEQRSTNYNYKNRTGYKYWKYSIDTSVSYKLADIKEYFTKYGYNINFAPYSNLVEESFKYINHHIYSVIITLTPNCENCE